jgi:tetratricopeptide (TPR) repeat protein
MSRTSKARRRKSHAVPTPRASQSIAQPAAAPSPAPLLAGISAALVALVWAVFGQTLHFQFLNYDDNKYVFNNAHVVAGISPANILWAFTHLDIRLWSPVTTVSHMLDCSLFHLAAGGHHFTNVLLHTAATVILFLALWQMTGAAWRCAFVAACFAIHPLHVESVAWVAERKDMLNGFFFALTLAAYVWYARGNRSQQRYLLVALFLALGLMAKPMLATVPCLLLLLDYWPLARIRELPAAAPIGVEPARVEGLLELILEKIPLLLIAAGVISVTSFAPVSVDKTGQPGDNPFPLSMRLDNGVAASLTYIRQMFWPADTAVIRATLKPLLSPLGLVLALLLLAAISGAVIYFGKKRPYLPVGWFWYLGMLVPVSGFSVLGFEGLADRYTYLPQIGLYLLLTWLVADATRGLTNRNPILGVAMAALVALMGWISFRHTGYWRDTETLWGATLAHTTDNFIAEENLGSDLVGQGRIEEGIAHYQRATLLYPTSGALYESLGAAFYQAGRLNDAIAQYTKALDLAPNSPTAHDNMGLALFKQGHTDQAIAEYQKALAINPRDPFAHLYLARVAGTLNHPDVAIAEYQQSIDLNPEDPAARNSLAILLIQQGRVKEAIAQLEAVLTLRPDDINATNNLAMILATAPDPAVRDGTRAVQLAGHAAILTGGNDPFVLSSLAAAYAECGRYSDAAATAQKALQTGAAQSNSQITAMLRHHLALYQSNTPIRDPSLAPHVKPTQ